MRELTGASVARSLKLPDELGPWLADLERIGTPDGGVPLPRGQAATAQLRRLGVGEPDLTTIAEALPTPDGQPELWWLLERAYHVVRRGIGQWDADAPSPSLPTHLGLQARCFWVFVFLAAADAVHDWHVERGIDEAISWDTLADLGRHVARYRRRSGVTGFDSQTWYGLHARGALYALGRLQFNAYRLRAGTAAPLFWYDGEAARRRGPGFQPGDPALGVHIPAGSPLTPAECDESLRRVRPFFRRHFPEHAFRVATCTSWLLDDQLASYLPPTSNIIRFQQRFELVPGAKVDDEGTFLFVFDRGSGSIDELVPRTTLERALIDHVHTGRHWHLRTGWLEP